MSINLATPELLHNPFPIYAHYRQNEPVALIESGYAKGGWFLSRYADVLPILRDPRFSSDLRKRYSASNRPPFFLIRYLPNFLAAIQNSMVMVDDPDHRRLRDLVHKAFTPARIENMNRRIHELCVELLDRAAQKSEVDLIADFALPLPLTIISEMMGVPPEERLRFHRWTAGFMKVAASARSLIVQLPGVIGMYRFLNHLIQSRRTDPQDDLVTGLVQAADQGNHLSNDETLAMLFLILLAGHETTVNFIGNGMLALLEHRDQMTKLHRQPGLIDCAIEELMRYGSPVDQVTARVALEDVEINGFCFPGGSIVLPGIASANRDESVFENADHLDIARNPNKHLGFGMGIHYCMGAPLARLEGRIAIQMLVQRFPNMQPAVPLNQLQWHGAMGVRGLKSLPVRLQP